MVIVHAADAFVIVLKVTITCGEAYEELECGIDEAYDAKKKPFCRGYTREGYDYGV